jgi:hypothetical protein
VLGGRTGPSMRNKTIEASTTAQDAGAGKAHRTDKPLRDVEVCTPAPDAQTEHTTVICTATTTMPEGATKHPNG